jgi:photosystem II stability/assembly factor-like uncharacterized protein
MKSIHRLWGLPAAIVALAVAAWIADPANAQQAGGQRVEQLRDLLGELRVEAERAAGPEGALPNAWVETLNWRNIGPSNMSGRIMTFAVVEGDPSTYWVGTAGGGLIKTTNNGATFTYQLQNEGSTAIGDVQVAKSNPDIVWAGMGEANAIRSGTYGDGVYKSIDGGRTWTHMGLEKAFQVGRIAIHPTNPDIVYVGASGRLWGTNPERGLYKTTDGGGTWDHILYVSDIAGVTDVKMHPNDPETLYVASYERLRDEYDGGRIPHAGGPGSAIWKTTDGGASFTKLEGGLPNDRAMGRIGLAVHKHNPDIIYAIIRVTADGSNEVAVWRTDDAGATWEKRNDRIGGDDYYYAKIYVEDDDPDKVWVLGVSLRYSEDGGFTFRQGMHGNAHVDHHAMWFNSANPNHIRLGNDGGIYETYDRARTWDHLNHVSIATFYDVTYDTRQLYRVYGGLQDNGSWGGPNRTRTGGGPVNEDWFSVGGGDGFVCLTDPNDPDIIWSESQNGAMNRLNLRTGESARLRPQVPEGERNAFNWKTPMILSHHNSRIFYTAGSFVFKSLDRGDDLRAISPKLTRTDRGAATALTESAVDPNVLYVGCEDGELWVTTDGGRNWENITAKVGLDGPRWVGALEASRFAAGRAYVAFDGHRNSHDYPLVYVTEDYGQTWTNLGASLPMGHSNTVREDLVEFGVFASLDRGRSWTRINNNLPSTSVRELRIHPIAGDLIAATHGRSIWIVDMTPLRGMTAEALAKKAHLYEPQTLTIWKHEQRRGGDGPRTFQGQNPPAGAQLYYSITQPVAEASLRVVNGAGQEMATLQVNTEPGLHRASWNPRLLRPDADPEAMDGNEAVAQSDAEERERELQEQQQTQQVEQQQGRGGRGGRGAGFQGRGGQGRGARGELGRGGQGRGGRGAQGRGGRRGGGRGGRGGGGGPAVGPGTYYAVFTADGETMSVPIRVVLETDAR